MTHPTPAARDPEEMTREEAFEHFKQVLAEADLSPSDRYRIHVAACHYANAAAQEMLSEFDAALRRKPGGRMMSLHRYPAQDDPYRVLPHRDVLDCSLYRADGAVIREDYEHVPCGMPLTRADIVDANWCPHCPMGRQTINKAAKKRANAEWK